MRILKTDLFMDENGNACHLPCTNVIFQVIFHCLKVFFIILKTCLATFVFLYRTESTLNYFGGFFKIVPKIWI